MKKFLFLFSCVLLFACSQTESNRQHIIMTYKDFGPPSLAHELIGLDFWQWDNHGGSRPRDYPIKVIVYRNVALEKIRSLYPVIKEKKQDFRYVEYKKTLNFLKSTIQELRSYKDEISPNLIARLIKTRDTIQSELGGVGADK